MTGTPAYRIGDIVSFTRTGRVVYIDAADAARVGVSTRPELARPEDFFRTDDPGTQHMLVSSANWPPVAGDVWRDRDGKRWLAVEVDCRDCEDDGSQCQDGYVALYSQFDARYPGDLQLAEAHRNYGPFLLELPSPRRDQAEPPW